MFFLSQHSQTFVMDSLCNSKKPTTQEPAQKQNQSSTPPPQKNAYARLLSQHNSSKFSLYLQQHMADTMSQIEELMPSTLTKVQNDVQNVNVKKGEPVPCNLSDSTDDSPLKGTGEASSVSLYLQKLVTRNGQQDCERKQAAAGRQQRGQRRDTTTSYDGDVESGEELHLLQCNQAKKQQKKHKDFQETGAVFGSSQSPKTACAAEQEQKTAKSKKKPQKNPEEDTGRQGPSKSGADTQMLRQGKDSKAQQTRGNLSGKCTPSISFLPIFTFVKSFPSSRFSRSQEQRRQRKKEASI